MGLRQSVTAPEKTSGKGLNHCPALKGIKTESAAVDACCAPSLNHCPALKGIKTKVSEQYWTGEKGV